MQKTQEKVALQPAIVGDDEQKIAGNMSSDPVGEIVATRYGQLQTLLNDRPISHALRLYGEWAQAEIDVLTQLLPPTGIIIDGGSHIGVHSRAFALASPGAVVHAFEPHPNVVAALKANVADLPERIVVHECALGTGAGVGYVQPIDSGKLTNAGAQSVGFEPKKDGAAVEVVSIDGLSLENIGFIKLDIEGAEIAALEGAEQTIRRNEPRIACEVNTLDAAVEIFLWMRKFGYATYLLVSRAFNPANFANSVQNVFGFASETALIFLPQTIAPPRSSELAALHKADSIQDLAQAFLSAPRYGDDTAQARNPVALRERLRAATARLDALSNDQGQKESGRNLAADLVAALGENNSLKNEGKSLQEELARIRADASASREHRSRAEKSVTEARETASAANERLKEALVHLSESEISFEREKGRGDALRDQLSEQEEAYKAQVKALQGQISAFSGRVEATERALALSQAHNERAQASLETLRQSIQALRGELGRLHSDLRNEQVENAQSRECLDVERARRDHYLEFLKPQGLSNAGRNLLGKVSRYFGGPLSEAHQEIRSSGFFDEEWYLKTYPHVAATAFDPIAHYLLIGGYEGLNPSQRFDTKAYLDSYSDVASSGINPLLHYLRWGRREVRNPRGLQTRTHGQPGASGPSPKRVFEARAPRMQFFAQLAQTSPAQHGTPSVNVVIPVFKGYNETLACLASVLTASNETASEVVVIDDCSPEPELSQALEEIADLGLIKLRKNVENLGFVRTANIGLTLSRDRDVVLLNSDTLVFNSWLDRLRAHARQDRVATVTPFTNNGTICSFPRFCEDNELPDDARPSLIDDLTSSLNRGRSVEVPTGVGFCLYVSRAAVREIGTLDEVSFGRGYGEENDFCMRAALKGWKNLHALDTFVFHSGAASFGNTASERKLRGIATVNAKHPGYDDLIQRHIANDPARGARIALEIARSFGRAPKETVLCITHALSGGIERHLTERALAAAAQGADFLSVLPETSGTCRARLVVSNEEIANASGIDLSENLPTLAIALKALKVRQIELHSTVGWSHRIVDLAPELARACGVDLKVVAHDYTFACPQTTLINETQRYCGELGESQCSACLSVMKAQPIAIHPDFRASALPTINQWRLAYGKLLRDASSVATPSNDAAKRLARYFPATQIIVEPHEEDLTHIRSCRRSWDLKEPLRLAVIGAIGPHKGSRVLLACAKDARQRNLPMQFTVVGYTDIDRELNDAGVEVTGKYEDRNVGTFLTRVSPHIALLPSVWPETYCYALSIALAAELPTAVFDLGAQAERLAGRTDALLLPIGLMTKPVDMNDKLLAFARQTCAIAATV